MPEQNENQTNQQPIFRMLKMYLKDLSFESPHAPQVFLNTKHEPRVDFDLKLRHKKIDAENYEVSLGVTAKVLDKADIDKTLFITEIEHAAIFLLRGIPEEHIERVLSVDAPFMLFPFTRQLISQVSLDGGFMPLLMEPVNFVAMYDQMLKQRQVQKKD